MQKSFACAALAPRTMAAARRLATQRDGRMARAREHLAMTTLLSLVGNGSRPTGGTWTDECCTAEPLRDRRRTSHRVFPYFLRDPVRDRGRDRRRRSDAVGPVDDVRRQAVPIARRD